MKKLFTLLALTISFSMNSQMDDNSANNNSAGTYAVAMGNGTTASGYNSTAMGSGTTASGDYSSAMGSDTTATGNYSTAMGYGTQAGTYASYGTAMGKNTIAWGDSSTAMGFDTNATGYRSTAMGSSTTASDFASVVIGQHNSSGYSITTSWDSFSTSNTAFVIGNGTASNAKSDAFKVMFNGDATVSNDLTVSGDVVISSDARLKSNIVSLGSTLPKLLQIDGKSYEMKGKQKIGVLAQEIQEVFPELVSEDDNEMLAVNYQGLVPVLINALKEQQSEIDELKEQETKYMEQEKRLERLEKLVANMD